MSTIHQVHGRQDHLTFRANAKEGRFGWLRLTPAYSVRLVEQIIDEGPPGQRILDPFCGTGTTLLLSTLRSVDCDTVDINPFLIWLSDVKSRTFLPDELSAFAGAVKRAVASLDPEGPNRWVPNLHQIEKWWSAETLKGVSQLLHSIREQESELPQATVDLLLIAFCRAMIGSAMVSFGHQSMSFKKRAVDTPALFSEMREPAVCTAFQAAAHSIHDAAKRDLPPSNRRSLLGDSRQLPSVAGIQQYSTVITSPPYPNRMSYIRELRPYMYWLRYLNDGRAAGELDWQAIGGTWGCATSNVGKWTADSAVNVPFHGFHDIIGKINQKCGILSRYVHKYFQDMVTHVTGLFEVTAPGARLHYVVGNSKFYDVLLPVEEIFASLFEHAGFSGVSIECIRKRTSKKELFEFIVRARRPA